MLGTGAKNIGGLLGASGVPVFSEPIFIGSTQTNTSPIAVPAGARPGDLLVLILGSANSSIAAVPTGFLNLFGYVVTASTNPVQYRSVRACTRLLASADSAFAFANGVEAQLLAFRNAAVSGFSPTGITNTDTTTASAGTQIPFPNLPSPPAAVFVDQIGYVGPYLHLAGIHAPNISGPVPAGKATIIDGMSILFTPKEVGMSSTKTYTSGSLFIRHGWSIGIRGLPL